MVSCTNITLERIRAEIEIGGTTFSTPDVKSFNVNKSRSQLAASFSAQIEVPATADLAVNTDVVIRAGLKNDLRTIFTGRITSANISPSFEKATTYIVNLSGTDRFGDLEGKTLSRRQRTRSAATFAAITGITNRIPEKGVSLERKISSGGKNVKIAAPGKEALNLAENSKLVKTEETKFDPFGQARDPGTGTNTGTGTGTGTDTGEGFKVHDHSTLEQGGPAFGVFSSET